MLKVNSIMNLDRICGEDDLQPRPGININPPPEDGRCECCGLHISQLKPFGKAGDPLVGDFDGAYLIKFYRSDFYCADDDPAAEYNSWGKSWECRDCIVLSEKEYHEKRDSRWRDGGQ
jgi:hypothetical protein